MTTNGDGDEEEGTGFVVSLTDGWEVTHTSSDVNAKVGYAIKQSDGRRQRVTVECVIGEPKTDEE